MADWSDELKREVIEAYKESNPTQETTVEITKNLANEYGRTPNSIMSILVAAGVYVTKSPAKGSTSKSKSKADSISDLSDLIEAQGLEPNMEILNKLTGKAANYFESVITAILESN